MTNDNKKLLKKWNLSISTLGEIYGYSSYGSFRNSSAYNDRIQSMCKLVRHLENELRKKYSELL